MIEIKVTVEKDVLDKETNLMTTIGTEETFVLPEKYNNADKTTLIRSVRDFTEKAITQHDEDALLED
jgi:hypothetical protein